MTQKINSRQIFAVLFITLLAIAFALALIWLSKLYPIKPEAKDWLDIMSAIGQAAGIVVLVGLIVELSKLRTDTVVKKTPDIRINAEIIDMNIMPKGHVCLVEVIQPFAHLHPQDGKYDADYVEAWKTLDSQKLSHFIRIEIVNRSDSRDAFAKDFKVQVELTLGISESAISFLPPRIFWGPMEGIEIPNGNDPVYVYIKCAPSSIKSIEYVTGKILDYKCVNLKGDNVSGKRQRFTPITITGRKIS
jgi:hypothetical protein